MKPTKEQLTESLKKLQAAQAEWEGLLKSIPGRNKTAGVRRILGSCPDCGNDAEGKHYCVKCRVKHTASTLRLQQKKHDQIVACAQITYNGDNH